MKTRVGARVGLMMGAGLCLACQLVSPGEGGLKLPDGLKPPALPIEPRIGDGDGDGTEIPLPDELPPLPPPQLPPLEPGTGTGTGPGAGTGPGTGSGPGEGAPTRPWLRASYYAGVSPQGLAVGDFNEDGAPDIAINAGGRGTQSEQTSRIGAFLWLRNDGAGRLEQASVPSAWTSSGRIVVGDLDGDGHQDVILGTARGPRMLRGSGTGSFLDFSLAPFDTGPVSSLGLWPDAGGRASVWSIAHARAQWPGSAGAFLSLKGSRGVWYSHPLNRNDGSGAPVLRAQEERTPGVIADFDADGQLDIALSELQGQVWTVNVQLGNALGPLGPSTSVPGAPALRRLYAARLNGDAHVDLLGLSDGSLGPSSLVMFPGTGKGDFSFLAPVDLVVTAQDLALVDYDGDGHLDVVVLHTSTGQVSLLRGGADGRFVPHARMKVGRSPVAAAVADLDRDGTLELLITEADDNVVSVYTVPPPPSVPVAFGPNDVVPAACPLVMEATPPGSQRELFPVARTQMGPGDPAALVAEDFNGDGLRDLAITREEGVRLMLRRGDGSFLHRVLADTARATGLSAGDFDGDGRADLAVTDSPSLAVLWNDPEQLFQARSVWAGAHEPLAGDFNGDGRVDLAVTFGSVGCQQGVQRLINRGQREFSAEVLTDYNTLPGGSCHPWTPPLAGDYDGDGTRDLVHLSRGININPTRADGTSGPGHGFELSQSVGGAFWSVDATGDGKLDVLLRRNSAPFELLLFPGDGHGSLLAPFSCMPSLPGEILAWADFDGDGLLDVLGQGANGSSVWVLRGQGHGRWHAPRLYGVGYLIRKVFAVNVTGDARPELVVATGAGELLVFELP